jgi:hypothetical protein
MKIITILLTILAIPCSMMAQNNEKPNIVLVFMDNFGWGKIGAYGGMFQKRQVILYYENDKFEKSI